MYQSIGLKIARVRGCNFSIDFSRISSDLDNLKNQYVVLATVPYKILNIKFMFDLFRKCIAASRRLRAAI